MAEDIFKDIERDIEKRRREESEREKKRLTSELGKHQSKPSGAIPKNFILISIIMILGLYIAYDYIFFHPKFSGEFDTAKLAGSTVDISSDNSKSESKVPANKTPALEQKANDTTVPELSIDESVAENQTSDKSVSNASNASKAEAPAAPKLSGTVTLTIDNIEKEKVSDALGYIQSVSFTIDNGKDTEIVPVVDVYAFDSETLNEMGGVSRGKYNKDKSIKVQSGEKHSVTMPLSPKSFSNLKLPKMINIVLTYEGSTKPVTATTEIIIN